MGQLLAQHLQGPDQFANLAPQLPNEPLTEEMMACETEIPIVAPRSLERH